MNNFPTISASDGPDTVIKPRRAGDILRDLLKEKGWDQGTLATVIGRPRQAVCETINSKRRLTYSMAIALAIVFKDDPIFGTAEGWMRAYHTRVLYDLKEKIKNA